MVFRKVKRVHPKSSHHKDNFFLLYPFLFSFYCVYMRRWMLAESSVVIISQYIQVKPSGSMPYADTEMCINYFSIKTGKKI